MAKGLEIERRWLLGGWDEEALTGRRRQIIQGYFDDVEDASKRIRIIDESEAVMTLKRGEGKVREEQETALGLDEARLQLAASVAVIRKARVKQSGWDVDFFAEPFGDIAAGRPLVVAEKELETEGEAVNLPGWMHEAIEVTGLLCTEMLADFAASLEFGESSEVAEDWEMPGKAWAVFVCGGTPDQRRRMLEIVRSAKPDRLADAGIIARRVYPKDEGRFLRYLIEHLKNRKKREQEALFLMSGETYADCWDVHDGPNPFNLRTHDMLTILLDELSAKRLTEGWCKSKHFGGFAHLQGRELFAHWAEEYRVHMIGQTASPAMQEWAVKQVLKPFFPDAG